MNEFRLALLEIQSYHENTLNEIKNKIQYEQISLEKNEQIELLELNNMKRENERIHQEILTIKEKIDNLEVKKEQLSLQYNNLIRLIPSKKNKTFLPEKRIEPKKIDFSSDDEIPFKQPVPKTDAKIIVNPIEPKSNGIEMEERKKIMEEWGHQKLVKLPSPIVQFGASTHDEKKKAFDYSYERKSEGIPRSGKRKSPSKPNEEPSPKKGEKDVYEVKDPTQDKVVALPIVTERVVPLKVQTKIPTQVPFSIDLSTITDVTQITQKQRSTIEIRPLHVVKKEEADLKIAKEKDDNKPKSFLSHLISDPVELKRIQEGFTKKKGKYVQNTPDGYWQMGMIKETQNEDDEEEKANSLTF